MAPVWRARRCARALVPSTWKHPYFMRSPTPTSRSHGRPERIYMRAEAVPIRIQLQHASRARIAVAMRAASRARIAFSRTGFACGIRVQVSRAGYARGYARGLCARAMRAGYARSVTVRNVCRRLCHHCRKLMQASLSSWSGTYTGVSVIMVRNLCRRLCHHGQKLMHASLSSW